MSVKLTWEEFKERFNKKGFNKLRLIDSECKSYGGSHSVIEVECLKHGKFKVESRKLLTAMFGCNECAKEYRSSIHRKTAEEFIAESKEKFGSGTFGYTNVDYINSKTKVELVCKQHGSFMVRPSDHLNKLEGCPMCKQSKLENMMAFELRKRKLFYIAQKKFDWLGKMSLDFYIPSINVGVECQGKQHFFLGGWSKEFDFGSQIERDKRKKYLCDNNGVKLIYITNVGNIDFKKFGGIYSEENTFISASEMFNRIGC